MMVTSALLKIIPIVHESVVKAYFKHKIIRRTSHQRRMRSNRGVGRLRGVVARLRGVAKISVFLGGEINTPE